MGDCFELNERSGEIAAARLVDCSLPHLYEVYALVAVDPSLTDQDEINGRSEEICLDRFEPFVGADYRTSSLDLLTLTPLAEGMDAFAVHCIVAAVHGSDLVGSMEGSKR